MQRCYKNGIWRTKLAFRLQICSFQFTNKHLALQTGTSDYNSACKGVIEENMSEKGREILKYEIKGLHYSL